MNRSLLSVLMLVVAIVAGEPPEARAQASEVTIADQFGIAYLPIMLMRDRKLLEKHALATDAGTLKVNWAKFGGAGAMNDALLSGSVDFAVGGLPPLILMWDKTKGLFDVKGVASVNNAPLYLVTRNPAVKSITDFTDNDKIALPSVKSSIQAIVLQMAAAQLLGKENYAALDRRTVSMNHPDAMVALLSGKGEVSAHFTSPPFQFQALAKPGIHRVLSSRDIVGDASFVVAYTTSKFYKNNPRIYAAFARAMDEAIALIRADKQAAAETYSRMTNGKEADLQSLVNMLNDPDMVFDLTPKGSMKYAEFMHGVGTIKTKPASWKDIFFPNTHSLPGS